MSRQATPAPIAITAAGFDAARALSFSQKASLVSKACRQGLASVLRATVRLQFRDHAKRRQPSLTPVGGMRLHCRPAIRCLGLASHRSFKCIRNFARNLLQTFGVESALLGSALKLFARFHCGLPELITNAVRGF